MKMFNSLLLLSAALVITACGGSSSGSNNLFDEVEQIQSGSDARASLSRTEDSILGYFEYSDGDLMKVEQNRATFASKDYCDGGDKKVEKQVSFAIEPITNEEQGALVTAQEVGLDYSDCPDQVESIKATLQSDPNYFSDRGMRVEGNSIVVSKGFVFMTYTVKDGKLYEMERQETLGEGDVQAIKLFDL